MATNVRIRGNADVIGRTLLHYRIEEKLGEGGMGVVYKARDAHLDRFVALKLLQTDKIADEGRKLRFVKEAKAASALNHPNIVHVYDIAESDGVQFIAMEYVEGKTLDALIGRKGLRLHEALRCAVQIADALARAHAAGIIHRDLKPSNVMVDSHGIVKVLDFGLAKLTERTETSESAATETCGAGQTEEGTILGTVAYMSPEQAEGKNVDARSDIFSFGALLYETITGRRAFAGHTRLSTLSAILHKEPLPLTTADGVPRDLEKIISRCLRKDVNRRFHHMIDLKVALEDLKEESDSGTLGAPAPRAPRSLPRWVAPVAMLLVSTGACLLTLWNRQAEPTKVIPPVRLTSDSGLTIEPALSPDGKLVAYASDRAGARNLDIWVQNVAGGEANRLTLDPADETEPCFSPDGSKIAFQKHGGGIYVIPSFGGDARMIANSGRRPRFSPDGKWIAYFVGPVITAGGPTGELYVVPSSGGPPRRIETQLVSSSHPIWVPDGQHLLFLGHRRFGTAALSESDVDWWVVPLEGGAAARTGAFDTLRRAGFTIAGDRAPVTPPGHWFRDHVLFSGRFRDSMNVWQIPISSKTLQVTGAAKRLTSGTGMEVQPSVALADDGNGGRTIRVAFASLVSALNVWSLRVDVNLGKPRETEPQQLTSSAYDAQSSLSLNGKRLAFVSDRSGNQDIWLKDMQSGKESILTDTPEQEFGPEIADDGGMVAYQIVEKGKWNFFLMPIGPGGQPGIPRKVCTACTRLWDLSADGKRILFIYGHEPAASVGVLDIDSGRKIEVMKHPRYGFFRARFSPGDQWISCIGVTGGGRARVYIAPLRTAIIDESEWIAVTNDESFHDKAIWAPNGNLLYFTSDRDGFRCIWAQRLHPTTKKPVGPPLSIYHSHSARRSLTNADILALEISAVDDRLVFHLGENTANIWMAAFERTN